jgi:hypothetical protein
VGRFHAHPLLGPEPLDGDQILLQSRHPLALGGAEGLELDIPVAERDTEDHLAPGHDVKGGELLGDIQRLVQ